MKLYQKIASLVDAHKRCVERANKEHQQGADYTHAHEWADKHHANILALVDTLPAGSGFTAPMLDLEKSSAERLVIMVSFHHMNDVGMYDGYTHHRVTVRPSLVHGMSITIGGRDRNGIKDYIHEAFACALEVEVSK